MSGEELEEQEVFVKDQQQSEEEDDEASLTIIPSNDQIINAIGKTGPWQKKMFFVLGFFIIPCTFPVLILTFNNASNDFWCKQPDYLANFTHNEWLEMSGQVGVEEKCHIFDTDYSTIQKPNWYVDLEEVPVKIQCTEWEYDRSEYQETLTTEWDLVCDSKYMKSTAQTLFFVGMLGGVALAGILSDKFGRKRVIVPLLLAMSVIGLVSALMPTFTSFVILRSVCALLYIGILECILTWLLETVGGRWTAIVGVGVEFFWVVGWLILALLAYLIRTWRLLLAITSVPGLLGVFLICAIPESPKWLLSVGRVQEAEEIVRKIAKANGKSLPQDWKLEQPHQEHKETGGMVEHLKAMVTHKQLLCKTLILYYNWFVSSFCYYGLTLNSGNLGGDVLVNFTIDGSLEFPAYIAAMIILMTFGRRLPMGLSMLAAGLSLLSILAVPSDNPDWAWAKVAIARLGKAIITFCFAAVYLYTAELFPTVMRTTGLGTSSFMARFGGMACSWIAQLGGDIDPRLPLVIYGILALVACPFALMLPETKDRKLPDTVEESEHFHLVPVFHGCCGGRKKKQQQVLQVTKTSGDLPM